MQNCCPTSTLQMVQNRILKRMTFTYRGRP